MDRRTFVGLVGAALAAAYVPKQVVDTVERINQPLPGASRRFIVTNAEWMRLPYHFYNAFRFVGHPELQPDKQVYCAVKVDDYILHQASRAEKNKFIRVMLEDMEKQVQSHLGMKDIEIVYTGKMEQAMRRKGVRL